MNIRLGPLLFGKLKVYSICFLFKKNNKKWILNQAKWFEGIIVKVIGLTRGFMTS